MSKLEILTGVAVAILVTLVAINIGIETMALQ